MGMVCFGTWPMFQAAIVARAKAKGPSPSATQFRLLPARLRTPSCSADLCFSPLRQVHLIPQLTKRGQTTANDEARNFLHRFPITFQGLRLNLVFDVRIEIARHGPERGVGHGIELDGAGPTTIVKPRLRA